MFLYPTAYIISMVKIIFKTTMLTTAFWVFVLSAIPLRSQTSDQIESDYFNILILKGEEKYTEAIEKFQNLIKNYPQFSRPYRSLVETYIWTDKLEGGRWFFETIKAENPSNAYVYYALARIDFQNAEYDSALKNLRLCIKRDPQFVDAYGPYGGITQVYQTKGDLDGAIQFFNTLLDSFPENPCIYYALGRTYQKMYDWDKAIENLQKTVELDSNFTLAFHSFIAIHRAIGQYGESLKNSRKLLELSKKYNDWQMHPYALLELGSCYYFYGDYQKALYYNNQAYQLAKKIGEKSREGIALNNIAIMYAMLGYQQKALEFLELSLKMVRKTGARKMEVGTLYNIGNVYKEKNEYIKGIQFYQQSLDLARERGYKYEESNALCGIAETFELQTEYLRAFENYQKAINVAREIDDKAQIGYILRALGGLNYKLGDYSSAIQFHQQALELGKQTNYLQIIWEAQAGLGASFKKQEKWNLAVKHYSQAIILYDSVRNNLDIEMLANNFLEDKYETFPSIIQLYARQKNFQAAFSYAEKYKSKILLDILAEGQIHIEELIPDSLRKQLSDIRYEIESVHKNFSEQLGKSRQDKNQILFLDQKITDLELRKSALINKIKDQFGSYYHLTSADPLSLKQIQDQVLGANQTLIEYIIGREKTSVFVVKSDSIYYVELDISETDLEDMISQLSPLFQRSNILKTGKKPDIFNAQLASFSISSAYKLYQQLFLPLEKIIANDSDLIIIPDDLLFYIPFEMFVVDTTDCETDYDFSHAKFLTEKYSISYSPAASILNPRLRSVNNSKKMLFAIGNPNFETSTKPGSQLDNILSENLSQLPHSEEEVTKIAKILQNPSNTILTGNQALENRFKMEAEDYYVLHLATHFVANDRQPLYSKIALTQTDNNNEDGFLHTYEIFNLHLNAELVVLSACNTGLGKLSKGQGLIGISRAFLYAGVRSLALSLWSVDDEATSEIMTGFYSHLKSGKSKKQALRQAKLDYLAGDNDNRRDPFYWAPFILIGNWDPMEFPEPEVSFFYNYLFLTSILILLISFVFWYRRKLEKA